MWCNQIKWWINKKTIIQGYKIPMISIVSSSICTSYGRSLRWKSAGVCQKHHHVSLLLFPLWPLDSSFNHWNETWSVAFYSKKEGEKEEANKKKNITLYLYFRTLTRPEKFCNKRTQILNSNVNNIILLIRIMAITLSNPFRGAAALLSTAKWKHKSPICDSVQVFKIF